MGGYDLMRLRQTLVFMLAIALLGAATASARTFGGKPVPISVAAHGKRPNGPSGGAAISGDDRKTRLAAFHSSASNLVPGDTNGVRDVFVWLRPGGSAGLRPRRGSGRLVRASVANSGAQANGPSSNPSLDGSLRSAPHCVAFESDASNLVAADTDNVTDVFVRDLRSRHTLLVSRGVASPATQPSIDGQCKRVAFSADGQVWIANVKGGRPRSLGSGSEPSFSRDGTAVAWVSGDGAVMVNRKGRTAMVSGNGSNPRVSDEQGGVWGVVFDSTAQLTGEDHNGSDDVYTREIRASGGPGATDLISAAHQGSAAFGGAANGGITSFGTNRGIVTFVSRRALWYRNNHSGNIDDLAHGRISGAVTSARANFVAYTAGNLVWFKPLAGGEPI
jgi:hypothetical protein